MISKYETKDENWESYGFLNVLTEYHTRPQGMISSMRAEKYNDCSVHIEFNIQSPSGTPDSSDFLTYTMLEINSFERAKAIVDMYATMLDSYILKMSA
jgi:hypothetical protein